MLEIVSQKHALSYEEKEILSDMLDDILEGQAKLDASVLLGNAPSGGTIWAECSVNYKNSTFVWKQAPCVKTYTKDLEEAMTVYLDHTKLEKAIKELL